MVSVEGSSLRKSLRAKSEDRRYAEIFFYVSSNSHTLGSIFSTTDLSTFEGSSDLLDFLTQLSASMIEKVGESVATLVVAVAAEVGTS